MEMHAKRLYGMLLSKAISDLLALRLRNQRLSNSDLKNPHDVGVRFGAMQAQEVLSSLNAVGLRIPGSTEAIIEAALANALDLHYVPAEGALWITRLLGSRQKKKGTSIYHNYQLTEAIFKKSRPILVKTLADGPKIRNEVSEALQAGGIDISAGTAIDSQVYFYNPVANIPTLDPTMASLLPAFDEYTVA